jgi:four helix bundle protein
MLLLKHTHLEVYKLARKLVRETYIITEKFPSQDKYGLSLQIRRAANSVKFNIAEGAARKSLQERKRFFEISRSSLVELSSAFETALDVGYASENEVYSLKQIVNSEFAMLCKLITNAI